MPYLYFAGSFNPIHHGHLIVARAAGELVGAQGIVLLPSAQNPFKPDVTGLASAADRLAMCELAVAGNSYFRVSDLELRRSGPSFTIDTVRQLRADGVSEIYWLIGADQLDGLPNWREIEELLAEVVFVVARRSGHEIDGQKLPMKMQSPRIRVVETPRIEISATQIRHRIQQRLAIDYLTPEAVVDYIREKKLYV